MDEQRLEQIWGYLDSLGQDVGNFDQFKSVIEDDPNRLRDVHSFMTDQGEDVGTWDEFSNVVGITPPKGEQNFLDLGFMNNTMVGDIVDDVARAISRGYRNGNTLDEAFMVMMRGSEVTPENIDQYIEAAKWQQEVGQSEQMQNFMDAGGFNTLEGWKQFAIGGRSIIPELIAESLTGLLGNPTTGSIIASGGLTSAATAGTGTIVAMPVATGLASGTMETLSNFSDLLQEELAERELNFDAEGIRTVLEDETAMRRLRENSLARGITIGTLDMLTGRIAGTVGGKVVGQGLRTSQKVGRLAQKFGVEVAGGAGGEFAAQVVAGEPLDLTSIGLEAFSELGSGAPNVFAPIINDTFRQKFGSDKESGNNANEPQNGALAIDPDDSQPQYRVNGESVTRGDAERVISENGDRIASGEIDVEVRNDETLSSRLRDKLRGRDEGLEPSDVQGDQDIDVETEQDVDQEGVERPEDESVQPDDLSTQQESETAAQNQIIIDDYFLQEGDLEGNTVTIDVEDLATGEKSQVELDAVSAQRQVQSDLDKIKRIRECF